MDKEETRFKTLMTPNGLYVDVGKLHKGIYTTSTPTLIDINTDIDSLIDKVIKLSSAVGYRFTDQYAQNLKSCQLVEVSLEIKRPVKKFNLHQVVRLDNYDYDFFVMEDNGDEKVLIANRIDESSYYYLDCLVERTRLKIK